MFNDGVHYTAENPRGKDTIQQNGQKDIWDKTLPKITSCNGAVIQVMNTCMMQVGNNDVMGYSIKNHVQQKVSL
jgi:hypothetical protein